ncbi:MAG: hypothetical protein ACREXS_13245 [Gammaproteobacteria bacterium]
MGINDYKEMPSFVVQIGVVTMFFKFLITAAGVFFISVPSIASAFDVGLGVGAHVGTFDAAGQEFTKELGPHSIRAGYGRKQDFVINWAAQNGKSVVFMLGYGQGVDVKTASGRQAYADRSADLAQTYGSYVEYYQVWNEWNGGFGLGCEWNEPPCNDAAMYTDLLCKTYKAIKAVQRSAKVAGGVVAGANKTFITGMLDAGAGDCMDVLDLHLYVYRQNWPGHVAADAPGWVGADKFIQVINDRQNLVRAKTGRTIPIIVSEAGFHGSNEQLEAEYITELYEQSSAVPFLKGIWWYQLKDAKKGNFGLLRNNNTKKPGFAAFQAAAARL